jgi:hypothetical protein
MVIIKPTGTLYRVPRMPELGGLSGQGIDYWIPKEVQTLYFVKGF